MNAIIRLLVPAAIALTLNACTFGATASESRLEMLQAQCGEGDFVACEELYWEAPLGSEYEAFALEQSTGHGEIDALEQVWSTMDARQREDLCLETEQLGGDAAYDDFVAGYGPGAPPEEEFADFVASHC